MGSFNLYTVLRAREIPSIISELLREDTLYILDIRV